MENTDIYRVLGGNTLDAIRHHISTSRAASEALRALLPEFGATKVILNHRGGIDHFEFPADPDPKVWKGGRYIARPRANTKAGKDLQARLTMMPRKPNWEHFTQALTGDTNLFIHISDDVRGACTWGRVRFVTPDESGDVWFLLVDREPGKPAAWTPPADECAPMKLSEYYAAIEAASVAQTEVVTGPAAELGQPVGA